MNDKLATVGCDREQRHVCINNGFVCLENAIEDLERLIGRVKGDDIKMGESEVSKPPQQCLADFMDSTTNRIDGYSERIRMAISELNQTIF